MKPGVSIVIPNFNGAKLLPSNLPAVLDAAAAYHPQAPVIVVDDGSSDESVAVIRERFPEVRLVVQEYNKGFSEAVYTGIMTADTELVFLLNSDVQPEPNVMQLLVEYFNDAGTFAVGPLIRDEDGKINRHSWNVRRFRAGNLKPVDWDLDQAIVARQQGKLPAVYVSGGSVMLRKSMFLALGGFHPMFKPFYGEDYDLGLRAWRQGWKSYFEPRVSVTHQRVGSSIKSNTKRGYVKRVRRRNKLLLEWTHLPAWRLWTSVVPLAVWQLLGELLMLDKVNILGFCDAVRRIPIVLHERRQLSETQRISFKQVLGQITDRSPL